MARSQIDIPEGFYAFLPFLNARKKTRLAGFPVSRGLAAAAWLPLD
jgi:hypothetical protein